MGRIDRIGTLVLVLGSVECGGDPSAVPFDEFASRLLDASCKRDVMCGAMPDQATCLAARTLQSTFLATASASMAAGRMHYNAGTAGACIGLLERLSCSETAVRNFIFSSPNNACATTFTGALAVGSGCFFNEECEGGRLGLCRKPDAGCIQQCCPGICGLKPAPLAPGDDCTILLAGQTCASGSVCGPTPGNPADRICAPLITTAGAACVGFDACALPLVCQGETAAATICMTLPARGAACNPNLLRPCDDDRDYCEPTTLVCIAKREPGSACSVDIPSCRDDAFCNSTTNVCTAQLTAGQPCGGQLEGFCLGDLQCDNVSCALPPPVPGCL